MKRDVGNNSSIDFILISAEKRQCGDGRTAGTHRHARIRTGKRKREKLHDGRAGGTHGKILRAGGEVHGKSERHAGGSGTDRRAVPRAESRKEHGKTRKAGDASGGVLARTAHE